ncbi:MAG: DUF1648 domain-containing protein [Clostridia bacterium]|nr:DUF1648 domain-containing protein [Clostridia bacterium]
MKFMKWKSFVITGVVCLLPIFLGLILWDKLPDYVAIHFDINNHPDNFASKSFAVFAMPLLMVVLQFFCCFVNDINAYRHGERKKFEKVTKWIIPCLTIILQTVTLCYAIGFDLDIRKVTSILVGIIMLVIGNYLPKFDYVKNYDVDTEKARKINRFIGFETVIMGVLFLISSLLPPIVSLCCIIMLIPFVIIAVVYTVKVIRE